MIKKEVVDAVKEGKFNIYPITRIEEGLEILTDMSIGEINEDGTYPEGTLNYLVAKRLEDITESLKAKKDEQGQEENNKNDK